MEAALKLVQSRNNLIEYWLCRSCRKFVSESVNVGEIVWVCFRRGVRVCEFVGVCL